MPELPEVETITNRLKPYLVGKSIETVIQRYPKTVQGSMQQVQRVRIVDVSRRAKMIRIQFDKKLNLLIHLKMTGQLIYVDDKHRVGGGHPTEDWISQLPSKHTRTEIQFTDHSKLFFNDQRLFGWIKILSDEQVATEFGKYAADVTDPEFTLPSFAAKIKHRSTTIKVVVMDNKVVSGVGNIYACDALNLARISPWKKANTLSSIEVERLYNSIKSIIQKGIDLGGATTDGKYIDVHGFAGRYQLEARVYDRAGLPCLKCGAIILKSKLASRGTYYCPECQEDE